MTEYHLLLIVYLCFYVAGNLGLSFLVGSAGRLSLAHGAFFALGAYAYAIFTVAYNWFPLAALVAAFLLCLLASLALSLPAIRLQGDFFVLLSLAIQIVLLSVITNWYDLEKNLGSLGNLTNGPLGVINIPPLTQGITGIDSSVGQVTVYFVIMILIVLLCHHLFRSPWNRALRAARDNELGAKSLGKSPPRMLLEVTAVACGLAGIAGAMYAARVGTIDPSLGTLTVGVLFLAMVIVGGTGNVWGSIFGAGSFILVPEALRSLSLPPAIEANSRSIIFGVLLVLVVHRFPRGLFGKERMK